jgi:hypothetical protein
MRMLALSPLNRLAQFAPLVVRVKVGVIISAHHTDALYDGLYAYLSREVLWLRSRTAAGITFGIGRLLGVAVGG